MPSFLFAFYYRIYSSGGKLFTNLGKFLHLFSFIYIYNDIGGKKKYGQFKR